MTDTNDREPRPSAASERLRARAERGHDRLTQNLTRIVKELGERDPKAAVELIHAIRGTKEG